MLSDKRKTRNQESIGNQLKGYRINRGLTQKELADKIGVEYYTMISQMELGYMAIPPALWLPIAEELQIDAQQWVLTLLVEYQPELYKALFRNKSKTEVAEHIKALLD